MTETKQANGLFQQLRAWQEQLIQGVLRAMVPLGFIAAAAGSYDAYLQAEYWIIALSALAYLSVLVVALMPGAPYEAKVWVVITTLFVLGVAIFFQAGRSGSARVFLLAIPFMAGAFFSKRASIMAVVAITLTTLIMGVAFSTGLIAGPADSLELSGWISGALVLAMLGSLMVVTLDYMAPRLSSALAESQNLTIELQKQQAELAQQVTERTADLESRSRQLEIAAHVAQEISVIQDAGQMMKHAVQLVSERFGHYHAAIFLLNETREYAVLKAASSKGGQRMLDRGHKLQVGKVGIVGFVAEQGAARMTQDVESDPTFFDNPDMPYTRSEMALPLRVRGMVIGVLDIQSQDEAAFSMSGVTILQTLADQIAVSINNVQLFQQVQTSLETERRAFGEMGRRAWRQLLSGRTDLVERYDPDQILPSNGEWRDEMRRAAQEGKTILGQDKTKTSLAIPLRAHDEIIGVINAHKPAQAGEWTLEEISLLETLTGQLNMALESARLYEETQRRAAREQLAGEVATRLRESLDVEAVLKTAADEIRQALNLPEVTVRLTSEEADADQNKSG